MAHRMNCTLVMAFGVLLLSGFSSTWAQTQEQENSEQVDYVSQDELDAFKSDLKKIKTPLLERLAVLMPKGEPKEVEKEVLEIAAEWFNQYETGEFGEAFEKNLREPCDQLATLYVANKRFISWMRSKKLEHKYDNTGSGTMREACDILMREGMDARLKKQIRYSQTVGKAINNVGKVFEYFQYKK